jgi:hypothetical protein
MMNGKMSRNTLRGKAYLLLAVIVGGVVRGGLDASFQGW